jgi:RNA polymerase sigma-54 factor
MLRQKLDIRQSQALVMTPQLQQAIRLLQMSNLELLAFVEQQLEENPLLVRAEDGEGAEDGAEPAAGGDMAAEAPVAEGGAPAEAQAGGAGEEADTAAALTDDGALGERLAAMDVGAEDLFSDVQPSDLAGSGLVAGAGLTGCGRGAAEGEGARPPEEVISAPLTLREHVEMQLPLVIREAADMLIAHELAGALDDAGYMREDPAEIAARLGTSTERVLSVLSRLQTLEPPGLFARDLKECLRLQLRARDRLDPAMAALVDNLELLARRDFARLKALCGVDEEDLAEMLAEIRALDPRPGATVAPAAAQPVVPDVFVRRAPDGSWIVELNSETLPRVLVDNRYMALVQGGKASDKDREFISVCHQKATWLVKSLDQRARTVLAVAREIVRQQDAFFHRGVEGLRPLTLKQVAEAVGMHESTVSRVTSNKFMATPRGIFEMKYFFTAAIATTGGEAAVSAEAVRHRIRTLIEQEDPAHVLSDDRIVDILRKEGIDIARRTVAKYREAMGIPSSVQRRREKRLMKA